MDYQESLELKDPQDCQDIKDRRVTREIEAILDHR